VAQKTALLLDGAFIRGQPVRVLPLSFKQEEGEEDEEDEEDSLVAQP